MRLAKSGSISKAQRKVKTHEERSVALIEGVYKKLNLVSELTRKILPTLLNFDWVTHYDRRVSNAARLNLTNFRPKWQIFEEEVRLNFTNFH